MLSKVNIVVVIVIATLYDLILKRYWVAYRYTVESDDPVKKSEIHLLFDSIEIKI